jgi:hypothetical protein
LAVSRNLIPTWRNLGSFTIVFAAGLALSGCAELKKSFLSSYDSIISHIEDIIRSDDPSLDDQLELPLEDVERNELPPLY